MAKKILIVSLPLFLLLAGLLLEKLFTWQSPEGRVVRLLALPPSTQALSSPLWDYRKTRDLPWKTAETASGQREYFWEGILDLHLETPGIRLASGGQEIPSVGKEPWNSSHQEGYTLEVGKDRLLIGNYFFASDHLQAFRAAIPWVSPVLEWEALAISNGSSEMTLGLSLDDGWKVTEKIGGGDWATYRVTAQSVQPGTYTLSLQSTGTFSTPDKKIQQQFFIRNLRARSPTRISVRLDKAASPPQLSYVPRNPVDSLLAGPPQRLKPVQVSPWAVYDESLDQVRPLEYGGLVRTALFLPAPARWEVSLRLEQPSDLLFYPVVKDPIQASPQEPVRLRVQVETSQGTKPFWEGTIDPAQDPLSLWAKGVRVPLEAAPGEAIKFVFLSESLEKDPSRVQPLFLGEPLLVPSSEHHHKHPGPSRPDVILISVDTLRADAVSCIGGGDTTPWMDQYFGQEGVVFTHAEAPCSWTLPSHASLFLSQYVSRHGVRMHYDTIPSEDVLLAERFAEEGYETAAFVDREFLNFRFGFHQGFFLFDQQGGHFASILPRALEYLSGRDRSTPLFLFLHTYDVHDPYDPPAEYKKRFLKQLPGAETSDLADSALHTTTLMAANMGSRVLSPQDAEYLKALYLAETASVDDQLKDFMLRIERDHLAEDPLVILLSDHGEAFREHGAWLHGWTLYEEEVHIPMLFHFPSKKYAGQRVAERVNLIDLAPTLFHLLGWEALPAWQGIDLIPCVEDPGVSLPDRRIYSELTQSPRVLTSVYRKRHKFIDNARQDENSPVVGTRTGVEAFDLETDPGETADLAGSNLEEATREMDQTARELGEMAVTRRGEGTIPSASLDSDTVSGLHRHGYFK
jgi:arylsulfatase A-like enzyme